MKIKIQIKSVLGKLLFELEKEDNTIKDTLQQAVRDGASLVRANLDGASLYGANLYGAKELDKAYLPIYMKWGIAIKGDLLRIGCKEKTFEQWDNWFSGKEEYSTKRDTEDFKRIQASFLAYKAYYEFMK